MFKEWNGFKSGEWQNEINVRDFIQKNYTPYEGNATFLAEASERTEKLWKQAEALINKDVMSQEKKVDTEHFSGINTLPVGYMDKDNEIIVGLQSDEPLKRIVNPYGGYRMVQASLAASNKEMNPKLEEAFLSYRKTHNDGVFDAYTSDMRKARTVGLLTGLPDAYGRGRIIGDYRRVPLYGIDFLKSKKLEEKIELEKQAASDEVIRMREEISEQLRALEEIALLGEAYGCNIRKPAETAHEAVQSLYLAYLAAVKENNGAAMSFGRNTTFLDCYIQKDLDNGSITEIEAQELIDQLVIKLRLVRHLRTPEYDELFGGDPTWITESIGGTGLDGRTLVSKTAFRFLHTLENLGPAPEPNMTVLWSNELPVAFKNYCTGLSIKTDSLQYENDDLMRPIYGDDYGIACCVSAMRIGKDMQFFGARANLAKSLLYAINCGYDEMKKDKKSGKAIQVFEGIPAIEEDVLDYDTVMRNYKLVLEKLAGLYVNTMNSIHYMHDKYAYERGQMALHDANIHRYMAFGIAGLSIAADSLSAIRYAKVKPIRNEDGISTDFEVEGDFPKFGNDDDRVDQIAVELVSFFSNELKKHPTYRNAEHTLSLLTITSNVVYGKKTGSTPDGRKAGEPFAPGANPMHGRDHSGALASLNSVAKLPYRAVCQDGISNTFSIVPSSLGTDIEEQEENLTTILDGYFAQNAFHLNINVLQRALLEEALRNPDKYPNLTIRVSGYAVHFNSLSEEQKKEVIQRTFHSRI